MPKGPMQIREAAGLVGDEQQEENPQDSFHFPLLKGKKERKRKNTDITLFEAHA